MPREQQSKSEKEEKQRLRNRSAQRAFRKRRAEQFKLLREQVNAAPCHPSNEHAQTIEDENRRLRDEVRLLKSRLCEVRSKLKSIQDSCSGILSNEDNTTSVESRPFSSPEISGPRPISSEPELDKSPDPEVGALGNAYVTPDTILPIGTSWIDPTHDGGLFFAPTKSRAQPREAQMIGELENFLSCSLPDSTKSMDGIVQSDDMIMQCSTESQIDTLLWNHDYQASSQLHFDIVEASSPPQTSWLETNSPISDHIEVLKTILRDKLTQSNMPSIPANSDEPGLLSACYPGQPFTSLYQSISTALALFNSMTRPDVMKWYAKTKFFHIVELTAWQIMPCSLTYRRLHQRYRPTALQLALCGQYPCVIDWIPFASVRDRIIESHAASPFVDRIFCDAVSAYVVETTLSTLVAGGSSMRVFIRVTDLIAVMALPPAVGETIASPTLPAPSIQSLLSSPEYARQAFKKLKMDRGASYYKIDPEFFGKYPELYDASDDITASGIPIKLGLHQILTGSSPINLEIVETYRSFIDFSFDALQAMSKIVEDNPVL